MVVAVIVALLIIGAGLAVSAVFMLAGLAWSLLAAAAALMAFAILLRQGLSHE